MGYAKVSEEAFEVIMKMRKAERERGFWLSSVLMVGGAAAALAGFGGVLSFDFGFEGGAASVVNGTPGLFILCVGAFVYWATLATTAHKVELATERLEQLEAESQYR